MNTIASHGAIVTGMGTADRRKTLLQEKSSCTAGCRVQCGGTMRERLYEAARLRLPILATVGGEERERTTKNELGS